MGAGREHSKSYTRNQNPEWNLYILETNVEPTIQKDEAYRKMHIPTKIGVNLSTPASKKMFYSPQHDDIDHQALNTQVEAT